MSLHLNKLESKEALFKVWLKLTMENKMPKICDYLIKMVS